MSRPQREVEYLAARLCQLNLTARERAQAASLLAQPDLRPFAYRQILVLVPHLDDAHAEIRAACFETVLAFHVAGCEVIKHLRDWLRLTTQGEVTHGLPATAKALEVCELVALVNNPAESLFTLERLERLWGVA